MRLTLCDTRELALQPLEVDKSDEEGSRLNVGLIDEDLDEGLEGRDARGRSRRLIVERVLGRSRRRSLEGRSGGSSGLVNNDDGVSFSSEVAWSEREKGRDASVCLNNEREERERAETHRSSPSRPPLS